VRVVPDAALLYGSEKGERMLRRALVSYLGRTRAISAGEREMLVTCGSSHAFALLWSALRGMGVRRVGFEDPGWHRISRTIAQAGLEPEAVRVDGHGLSVADLYGADVQAVVVSPAHQYPTGVIMHPARRAELVGWARRTGGLIIEDDYDAEFRFGSGPIAPLRAAAPDCVVYTGTTSKILAPALRLGWLLAPARLADVIASEHAVSYAQPAVTNQRAFAALLETGEIDRHLRKARNVYRRRRSVLLTAIKHSVPWLRLGGGAAGLHMIAWLPPDACEERVITEAAEAGIALDGLRTRCTVTTNHPPALVLGYGAIAETAIPEAIARLAPILQHFGPTVDRYDTTPAAA
jgi:GntR family transcriptional regulator/MocR family aminotransferase